MIKHEFLIPDYIMEYFETYHQFYLKSGKTRTMEQTFYVLIMYSLGYTAKIQFDEILLIEDFFYRKEHLFQIFLEYLLCSLQDTVI